MAHTAGENRAEAATSGDNGFAPFACNVCNKSYSRVDHLARHYRSHTKLRPYPCETCGKHFSRADLLRRHSVIHNSDDTRKRKRTTDAAKHRVSLACTSCSAAKVKCEEDKPCGRCVQGGLLCELPKPGTDSDRRQRAPLPDRSEQPEHDLSEQPTLDAEPSQAQSMKELDPIDGMVEDAWGNQETSFGDFLADIMTTDHSPAHLFASNTSSGAPERDVLNFGIEDNIDFGNSDGIDFSDFDFGIFGPNEPPLAPVPPPMLPDESYPPSRADYGPAMVIDAQTSEAFQNSLWRWIPREYDRGQGEQMNLSLPANIGVPTAHTERPCQERLAQPARDRIMAMVMATCDPSALPHVVSHFPSAEMLDCLVQDYLFLHQSKAESFIHVPTYAPNDMRSELVAMTAACGAVMNSVPAVRKLGFALQEAVRLSIPKSWEKDNSLTRDLALLQSYIMWLDAGLWSGNKRKMEISESHGLPVVTMLRRSGRFRKLRSPPNLPTIEDSEEVLNSKWRTWVEAESFKRLVFALLVHDSQTSMSFFVPPLITANEISLELPASRRLWRAPSAKAWRDLTLLEGNDLTRRLPNLATCMHDPHHLIAVLGEIDVEFATELILSTFWRQMWNSRQLSLSAQHGGSNGAPASNLYPQTGHGQRELGQAIQHFRLAISDRHQVSPCASIEQEHLLLNVFVSFEELSFFAGKEGTTEARRTVPKLREWINSRDSRQAVWHAGQILREATAFPLGALRGFYAITLYHAGLTLWAYGLLSTSNTGEHRQRQRERSISTPQSSDQTLEIVFVDGPDSPSAQKFIALNRARPAIHGFKTAEQEAIFLDSPRTVMEIVISVLQENHGRQGEKFVPPLVENLTHLMRDLSRAAMRVALSSTAKEQG